MSIRRCLKKVFLRKIFVGLSVIIRLFVNEHTILFFFNKEKGRMHFCYIQCAADSTRSCFFFLYAWTTRRCLIRDCTFRAVATRTRVRSRRGRVRACTRAPRRILAFDGIIMLRSRWWRLTTAPQGHPLLPPSRRWFPCRGTATANFEFRSEPKSVCSFSLFLALFFYSLPSSNPPRRTVLIAEFFGPSKKESRDFFDDVVKSRSYARDHGRRRFWHARLKMLFIAEYRGFCLWAYLFQGWLLRADRRDTKSGAETYIALNREY